MRLIIDARDIRDEYQYVMYLENIQELLTQTMDTEFKYLCTNLPQTLSRNVVFPTVGLLCD